MSDDVLNRGGSYVSGLHCQEGQTSKISQLYVAVPSTKDNPDTIQMGGVKTTKRKKKSSQQKKYKKTVKKNKHKKRKRTRKQKTVIRSRDANLAINFKK